MKVILLFFCLISFEDVLGALTEAQMKSTAKLLRNACQPKSKATDEQIENMHKGIWNYEKSAGCYLSCCLKMMKVLRADGKMDLEVAKKQIATLPEARRAPTLTTLNNCAEKVVEDTDDKCELAFKYASCMYFDNPDNYFFP